MPERWPLIYDSEDFDGARLLRFVIAYVTTEGLAAIGVDRLADIYLPFLETVSV